MKTNRMKSRTIARKKGVLRDEPDLCVCWISGLGLVGYYRLSDCYSVGYPSPGFAGYPTLAFPDIAG